MLTPQTCVISMNKIVTCKNDDWNIGLRRCPEKMSSLGGPTLKKFEKIYVQQSMFIKM